MAQAALQIFQVATTMTSVVSATYMLRWHHVVKCGEVIHLAFNFSLCSVNGSHDSLQMRRKYILGSLSDRFINTDRNKYRWLV